MEIVPSVRGMQPRRGCQCVNKIRIQSTLTNREKLNSHVYGPWFGRVSLGKPLATCLTCDYLIYGCKVCVAVTVLTGTVFVEVLKCVLYFQED